MGSRFGGSVLVLLSLLAACKQNQPGGECSGFFTDHGCANPMVCVDPGPEPGTSTSPGRICIKPCEKCPGITGENYCCPAGQNCAQVDTVRTGRYGGSSKSSAGWFCAPARPWNEPRE